jgi:predicted KAP-like P-loop ATPase
MAVVDAPRELARNPHARLVAGHICCENGPISRIRGGPMFLIDQETEVDLLYYEAIAKTVVRLVRDRPEAPVTIGVHGDWGAGKSSILKMTSAALATDDRVLCLWFNGWTFEGFEDAKTVVIETIVSELRRARPKSAKVADAARKLLKRVDWLKLAKKAGGLAFTAVTGIPTLEQLQGLASVARGFLAKPHEHIDIADIKSFASQAGDYIKAAEDDSDHLPDHIHAFREEFAELLEAADIDQLVVIVDDLDRCLPETAIATLEAIRLFLFVPRTAFVIGADETMIEYAVREHFPDLPPSSGPVSYARNYLEKLIQVPFRVPALGVGEVRTYITLLLAEAALGSTNASFKNLLDEARKALRRPWENTGLTSAELEKSIGKLSPAISQALTMGAQVGRILAEGTRGNPRQIKRFLNSMMLRYAIAEERGFSASIERSVLAKVMLAERFYPDFYEYVARLAAGTSDGKSAPLAELENHVRAEDTEAARAGKGGKAKADRDALSPELEEWVKNEWVTSWAKIDPPVKDVDLRPYVFVTRDKRSQFGVLAAAGHLESIVDRMMGSRLAVQAIRQEIEKLSGGEPEQAFDAISMRIEQTESLQTEPRGVQGLIALVAAHSGLQRRLLSFVKNLPTEKLGVWAATFGGSFKDVGVAAEWDALLRVWTSQTQNTQLSAAASGALSLRKK